MRRSQDGDAPRAAAVQGTSTSIQGRAFGVHAVLGSQSLAGCYALGKSTLGHVLAGRPGYEVSAGSVTFEGREIGGLGPTDGDVALRRVGIAACDAPGRPHR